MVNLLLFFRHSCTHPTITAASTFLSLPLLLYANITLLQLSIIQKKVLITICGIDWPCGWIQSNCTRIQLLISPSHNVDAVIVFGNDMACSWYVSSSLHLYSVMGLSSVSLIWKWVRGSYDVCQVLRTLQLSSAQEEKPSPGEHSLILGEGEWWPNTLGQSFHLIHNTQVGGGGGKTERKGVSKKRGERGGGAVLLCCGWATQTLLQGKTSHTDRTHEQKARQSDREKDPADRQDRRTETDREEKQDR